MIASVISILVIALTLYILIHVSLPNAATTPNAAEQAASAFYTAIKKGDYPTAYTYLADTQQAQLTQYSFTLFAKQQDLTNGIVTKFQEIRYDRDQNTTNQAVVQEQVTRANGTTYAIGLRLRQASDGSWKIYAEDHTI